MNKKFGDSSHVFDDLRTADALNATIDSGEFKDIVRLSEAYHDKRTVEIAKKIADSGKRIVLIAGPSSSGKTTFAKKLCVHLRVNGLKPVYMSTDDFFLNREETPVDENGEKDYENLSAVDVELFNRVLNQLLAGEETDIPEFDFIQGKKIFGKHITKISKEQPIVIEGIHALNDDLTPHVPKKQKFKIFICPEQVIEVEKGNIEPVDYRMIRRMVRDYKYRGKSAVDTIKLWPKVRAGEEKNIFPYRKNADVEFNSAHIYEFCVLKKHACKVLKDVEDDIPESEKALQLLEFLDNFKSYEDDGVVSNDSILCEFVGGSLYSDDETGKGFVATKNINFWWNRIKEWSEETKKQFRH